MKLVNPVIPDEVRLDAYPRALRLTHNGELYANPAATRSLDATGTLVTHWLLYDELTPQEFALHWVPKQPGAVKARRSKNGNTLQFSGTPLLLKRPDLRVDEGRIRLIPFRIDQTDEGPRFVLELAKEDNVPSSRKTKR